VRLAAFRLEGATRIGVVDGDELVDLSVADPALTGDWPAVLALGPDGLDRVVRAVSSGLGRSPLADAKLAAPIARPGKFLGVGLNYADHVLESGMEVPDTPTVFGKMATSVVGPYDPIESPAVSQQLDYEGELGLVIGTRCKSVSVEQARSVIAGYLVVNDVSVRDWQLNTSQWTVGKSFDTHGPIGPWIVTRDELPDPHDLAIRTYVNDELRQESNTSHLIHDSFALVSRLSQAFTLEPGDIVATGTPAGVGGAMDPPTFLTSGDVVRVEIDGIGAIENHVVDARVEVGAP
jgi:2-keto-4-pentenoate hydratase/2-oxohepta-3-ene-1,7-dioic acid hydratase in catechol pathway